MRSVLVTKDSRSSFLACSAVKYSPLFNSLQNRSERLQNINMQDLVRYFENIWFWNIFFLIFTVGVDMEFWYLKLDNLWKCLDFISWWTRFSNLTWRLQSVKWALIERKLRTNFVIGVLSRNSLWESNHMIVELW